MGTLLNVVGKILAVIGAANIVMMPWSTGGEGLLTAGLMFNVLLFIVPGLVVAGIGVAISNRTAPKPIQRSLEQRLEELASLRDKGLISPQEFDDRRTLLLQET